MVWAEEHSSSSCLAWRIGRIAVFGFVGMPRAFKEAASCDLRRAMRQKGNQLSCEEPNYGLQA